MAKKSSKRAESYRKLSDELAEIISWFESDEIDLDMAVNKYEQAIELILRMEAHLKTAENKIQKISAKFESE